MANKTEFEPKSEKNLAGYDLAPLKWERARFLIEEDWKFQGPEGDDLPHTHWLTTVRPDGRPHVVGIGAFWHEGSYYFCTGAGTRKAKNLAKNPNCTISFAGKGMDVVVEGTAKITRDQATLETVAKIGAEHGWGPEVKYGAFYHEYSAPSAGPPPWDLYVMTPRTVFGLATEEPYGATRWKL